MQLIFPNGEHAEVQAGIGKIRLGSAPDNEIVLADLRALHACLVHDARGIVLEVVSGARAHVNARPVREKAFVRYGDTLCLDTVTIIVSAQGDGDDDSGDRPQPVQGPQRGVIRGVSGTWFGKSIVITDGLVLSRDKHGATQLGEVADGSSIVRFEVNPSGLILHSAEAAGTLLNGHRRTTMALRMGDQLALGRDRFVVECSKASVPVESPETEDPSPVPDMDSHEQERRSGRAIWWLIGAAALIGLVLVGILLRGT